MKLVRYSAALVLIGTLIDVVAHLAVVVERWAAVLSISALESVALSSYGVAVGLRAGSAAMLFGAIAASGRAIGSAAPSPVSRSLPLATVGALAADSGSHTLERPAPPPGIDPPTEPRLHVSPSFTFDGHTVTEGNRMVTGIAAMVHVVAGAVWSGDADPTDDHRSIRLRNAVTMEALILCCVLILTAFLVSAAS